MSHAIIYPLNEEVVDQVVQLRRQHKIKLTDAIIAATAMVQKSTLVIRNTQDFEHLQIRLLNPFETRG